MSKPSVADEALLLSSFTSRQISVVPGHTIDEYRHEKLPDVQSFRVMSLLPGKEEDPVRFELQLAEWTKPPAYEAISYVWGKNSDVVQCDCGGKSLFITRNLHEALLQFRLHTKSRILWADGVWCGHFIWPPNNGGLTLA